MEYIKNFIIILVTTIIFITAVEIIAPDKPIKKYIKFVLNLLLVSVLLNPIVYIFTKGEGEIVRSIDKYEQMLSQGTTASDSKVIAEGREEAFKENLNKNCTKLLQDEFKDKKFDCEVICTVDLGEMTYDIEKVNVGVKDNKIKLIDKINIDTSKSTEVMSSNEEIEDSDEIMNYLTEKLSINREKIDIYKMEGSE